MVKNCNGEVGIYNGWSPWGLVMMPNAQHNYSVLLRMVKYSQDAVGKKFLLQGHNYQIFLTLSINFWLSQKSSDCLKSILQEIHSYSIRMKHSYSNSLKGQVNCNHLFKNIYFLDVFSGLLSGDMKSFFSGWGDCKWVPLFSGKLTKVFGTGYQFWVGTPIFQEMAIII